MGDVTRIADARGAEGRLGLDELAREGARRMITVALEAEVDDYDYVQRFLEERDEDGRRLVVRNGRGQERRVTVGSGTLPIRAPRVSDRRVDSESGERRRFSSSILPRYARRSPNVTDVLPVLYLRRLSCYDYLFADGVHVSVRLGEDKRLCLLVVIGVREDGRARHTAWQ